MLLGSQAGEAYMVKTAISADHAEVRVEAPVRSKDIVSLNAGDRVVVSGLIITANDAVHRFLFNEMPAKKDMPFKLEGSIIYHCGPLIKKTDEGYKIIAACPSSSARFEMYVPMLIKKYGIKAIMGKGGMGKKTMDCLKESGAVYLQAISAPVSLAGRIKRVVDGWKIEEFGVSEAMWLCDAEAFPAIVTMDAHGNSLYDRIKMTSFKNLNGLLC